MVTQISMGRKSQVIAQKGWLLTVREPLNASSAMRVRFPLAKTPSCGNTCPSSLFRRAVENGLSVKAVERPQAGSNLARPSDRLMFHFRLFVRRSFGLRRGSTVDTLRQQMSAESYEREIRGREARQKHWEGIVSAAVKDVEISVLKNCAGFHSTTFFGAMGINPKHLAIWCFFKRDDDLKDAKLQQVTERINHAMREALNSHGYPESLLSSFFVSFATDEDVQRTCGGNYWHYLK